MKRSCRGSSPFFQPRWQQDKGGTRLGVLLRCWHVREWQILAYCNSKSVLIDPTMAIVWPRWHLAVFLHDPASTTIGGLAVASFCDQQPLHLVRGAACSLASSCLRHW